MLKRMNVFNKIKPIMGVSDDFMDWLVDTGYFTTPASTKYHGAHECGLFDHSRAVAEILIEFTEKMNLEWQNPRSPWVIGHFHDLCKIDQYKKVVDKEGVALFGSDDVKGEESHFEYNADVLLTGHGDKSVMLLSRWLTLTEEEILCIRYHMGAYETKEWELYDRAIRKFPNVLWTHHADMYASKAVGV